VFREGPREGAAPRGISLRPCQHAVKVFATWVRVRVRRGMGWLQGFPCPNES
jgi:hypothetical protein